MLAVYLKYITYLPMLVWVAGILLSLAYRWRNHKKFLLTLIACVLFLSADISQNLITRWVTQTDFSSVRSTYLTLNIVTMIIRLIAWGILFYTLFNSRINAVEKRDPPTTEKISKKDTITILVVGAVIASIGGGIKFIFGWYFGIPLMFYYSLLTPIVGAMLAWICALIGHVNSNSRTILYVYGIIGGILAAFALLPAPIIAY